jgi:hypothetical protein
MMEVEKTCTPYSNAGRVRTMNSLLQEYLKSPTLVWLSIVLFLSESITTFDVRIIQAKRSGVLPADHPNLPRWVLVFHVLDWLLLGVLMILNWRVGLSLWACIFLLKVLPVLESVGNIVMAPFKKFGADHDKIL